jgi:uncharacterized LabA/DUF88 family protein
MEVRNLFKVENSYGTKIFPSDPTGSLDDFLKVIVFVDNAYLIRLKNYFFKNSIKYSLRNLIEYVLTKNNFSVEKIFLYDSPPFQNSNPGKKEKKMKEVYDEFINRFRKEGIIVREGRTQRIKVNNSFLYKQKGVDMLFGIDAVGIINDFPEIKNVVFLTGDSDFVPVVDKLKSFGVNVILLNYFDKKRNSPFSRSNYLIKSVFKSIRLTKQDFEAVLK